jgi:hypothetical protein
MKIIVSIGAVVIVLLAVVLFTLEPATAPAPAPEPEKVIDTATNTPTDSTTETPDTGRRANPDDTLPDSTPTPDGKLKVSNFSGKLQEVSTGCFSDGECYVVVDGKHITTTMGWSQETVGTIIGAPSIGDMETMIGSNVEVYARDNSDGTYSLYGSEGFYVKVTK